MGFTILQWNSRSIFEKWHDFKNYLPKYQPSIPHYHAIRKDRPPSKGKGIGLMVCVKTSIDFSKIDVALSGSSNLEVLGIACTRFFHI